MATAKRKVIILRRIWRVLLTSYAEDQFEAFKRDIRPLRARYTDRIRVLVGSKRQSRAQQVAVLFMMLYSACHFLTLACVDLADQWRHVMGDYCIGFGPYAWIINLVISSIYCATTGVMLALLIIAECADSDHSFETAFPVWTTWLDDQDFQAEGIATHLTNRGNVFLWKYSYLGRLFSLIVSLVVVMTSATYISHQLYTVSLPLDQNPLYYAVLVWWTAWFGINMLIVGLFGTFTIGIISSQMLYYALAMRNVTSEMRINRSLVTCVRQIIKWRRVEVHFKPHAWMHNLIMAFAVPGLLAVSILWFYTAQHYSLTGLLTCITYLTSFVALGGTCCFLLSSARIHLEQHKFGSSLYRVILSRPPQRGIRLSHGTVIRCKTLIRQWIKHESGRSCFIIRCGAMFEITFQSTIMVLFETVSYYLLTITTIGVPRLEDLTQLTHLT